MAESKFSRREKGLDVLTIFYYLLTDTSTEDLALHFC